MSNNAVVPVMLMSVLGLAAFASGSNCGELPGSSSGICLKTVKLDAEEAGYTGEYRDLIYSASKNAFNLFSSRHESRKYAALEDQESRHKSTSESAGYFKEIKNMAKSRLSDLSTTLPPDSMRPLHGAVLDLLQLSERAQGAGEVEEECLRFFKSAKQFSSRINSRPDVKADHLKSEVPINIAVRPAHGPIGASFNGASGEFTVLLAAATPLGTVSLSPSQPTGAQKLIVKYNGKQRFFTFDRSYQFNPDPHPNQRVNVIYDAAKHVQIMEVREVD